MPGQDAAGQDAHKRANGYRYKSHLFGAAAYARVVKVELHPAFRYSGQFSGVNCAPALAEALGGALRDAGLPE